METAGQCILTVNGGSSGIKFALFATDAALSRILQGRVERIGSPSATFKVEGRNEKDQISREVDAPDHRAAVEVLMDWLEERIQGGELLAVGHRVVHGGPKFIEPQQVTRDMIKALHDLEPFDPTHLPEEILLTEAFHERFPGLTQIACFDTAFHRDLPRCAQLLPIPRRYFEKGVRRYGFHGLSYQYLMLRLKEFSGADKASGRIILAHLGNGASLAAVRGGRPIDTSMSFTPTAGIPMSTRAGDLDPGLAWYLARTQQVSARAFHEMVNHESGLLGISETHSDMRDLLELEKSDSRAADAVAIFCYQIKKTIGAYAAALGGLDTLVFSGGIGEHLPAVRARVMEGLGFLGIEVDLQANEASEPVISAETSQVTVRVISTDEEWMIAKTVRELLKGPRTNKDKHE